MEIVESVRMWLNYKAKDPLGSKPFNFNNFKNIYKVSFQFQRICKVLPEIL